MSQDSASSGNVGRSMTVSMPACNSGARFFRVPALAAVVSLVLAGCAGNKVDSGLSQFKIPANDPSFRSRVYAGAGFGGTNLDPDTSDTAFSLDNGSDSGTQLRIGADAHNRLAFEIESAVLGAAQLAEAETSVAYSAVSLNALVYGLNGVQSRSRRQGWSAYGRLGFARVEKSSQVLTLDQGITSPVFGIGGEYGFRNGLGVRGEVTRYSGEATFFGLSAIYRFGRSPRELGSIVADAAQSVVKEEDEGTATASAPGQVVPSDRYGSVGGGRSSSAIGIAPAIRTGSTASNQRAREVARSRVGDVDLDGIADTVDQCQESILGSTVDEYGCGLFDAILGDVVFKTGSWHLNARARGALDEIALKLAVFPEVRVEVRAHTDSQGTADNNLALSARRAESVVQYLRSRGISELQLEGRGVGEAQPIVSNRSAEGRQQNRRVELVTIANLRAQALEGQADRGSVWEYSVDPEAQSVLNDIDDGALKVKPAPERSAVEVKNAPSNSGQPELGAAFGSLPGGGLPPIDGLKPSVLPAPGFVAGFSLQGVVDGLGFAPGSAELSEAGSAAVARIRAAMSQHPSARIAIMAHTDNSGDREDNLELSEKRARRVVDLLVDAGVARSRLVPEGYGDSLPLVQNVTDADRARNRRVEIRLVR